MKTPRVLALLLALVLPLLAAAPARATGASVTVHDMMFSPARVSVAPGQSVTWTFQDAIGHTVTSDQGFFDTGIASNGATRSVSFASAGTFGYHCSIHPMMTGKVVVPLSVTGSAKAGWKLRWLVGSNPKGRSYDVQVRRVGTKAWTSFRKATTTAYGVLRPGSGSWQARARTLKGAAKSGWSPAARLG